ncbi:helix-turn-helix domain-containing protein [Aquimarina brevivitae]|nr:helix-turn-helix domain-containing protein [Aquimarina brevivitae]
MRLFGLGYYDGWYYIMIDLSWVHGALIYFYTKAQTQPNLKIQKKQWIHLLPVGIQIICSVFVRLQNIYWDGTRESLSWLGYYGYVVWMNNPTIYIIASLLIIGYAYKSRKLIEDIQEIYEISNTKLKWIKRIVNAFLLYFCLVFIILLADLVIYTSANQESYFYFTRFYYYPFFIGIAILTYWIGVEGFSRRNDPEIEIKKHITNEEQQKLQELADKLEAIMKTDKLYKNQELSLQKLAQALETKSYLISRCLSVIFDKRFNDYINAYRVKEVQELLKDADNSKYTLLSLALEAGFNSKSSFNRAIKKQLGVSPSDLKLDA